MATTYGAGDQKALAATTLQDVYTVPGATSAVMQVVVCNRGAATTFRIAHAKAGAADNNKQYFEYDTPIAANQTIVVVTGLSMAATDVIRGYAGTANVTVQVNGI